MVPVLRITVLCCEGSVRHLLLQAAYKIINFLTDIHENQVLPRIVMVLEEFFLSVTQILSVYHRVLRTVPFFRPPKHQISSALTNLWHSNFLGLFSSV